MTRPSVVSIVLATTLFAGGGTAVAVEGSREPSAGRMVALRMSAAPAPRLAAGGDDTCAITGGGALKCWGANAFGQLGDGTTTKRVTPVAVSGLGRGVAAVALSGSHTCALTTGGAVKCWGWNHFGQAGDGTTTDRSTPVTVSGLGSGVVAVSAGREDTCAVTAAGAVKCWGANRHGQLGDGTKTNRSTPVAVSGLGSRVKAVVAGLEYTCALTTAGGVKCWGANALGQIGDGGPLFDRPTPVEVSGLGSGVIALDADFYHTCAVTNTGALKCWGGNWAGQIGDGTKANRSTPVAVSGLGSGVAAVSTGVIHTCALTDGAAVMCWGSNISGELGDGTTTNRYAPVAVSGLGSGVKAVVTGGSHTCALTGAGAARCWGKNNSGQLGDGTTTGRRHPVSVTVLGGTTPAGGHAVRVSAAAFAGTWRESVFHGGLTLSGRAVGATRVRVEVRRGRRTVIDRQASVGAGSFHLTVPAPPGLLPGGFLLRVLDQSSSRQLLRGTIRLGAPVEGVVDRAEFRGGRRGPPIKALPANASEIWVYFHFAALPKNGPVKIWWYPPRGPTGPAGTLHGSVIASGQLAVRGAVTKGLWRAAVRAGSATVKQISIRVGG